MFNMDDFIQARDAVIREKFHEGYTASEIHTWMIHHFQVNISLRHVHRVLKKYNLRRCSEENHALFLQIVEQEIIRSGSQIGYRTMWTRLLTEHNIQVSREDVRIAMKLLDPAGSLERQRRRLRRRKYRNLGPNYTIHTDQYDKIRPYGMGIQGAIDGYSRKILWLKVARTNRNPKVVGAYFLDYVRQIKAVPRLVRMDRGSENVAIIDMQKALRNHNDRHAGERSVLLGKSSANQRIEQWWGRLRINSIQSHMDLLSDLAEEGLFFKDIPLMVELVRFCFIPVIQKDLDMVRRTWNRHRIRKNNHSEAPSGKPEMLFRMPELTGGTQFSFPVQQQDIDGLEQFVERPDSTLPYYRQLFQTVMTNNGLLHPTTREEAGMLYAQLLDELKEHEEVAHLAL